MVIVHSIDSLLAEIFPEIADKIEQEEKVKEYLIEFYTLHSIAPAVTIKDNLAYIEIDDKKIIRNDREYTKVVKLCESGKYDRAKPLLEKLINENPYNSDYYRIYGQIKSEEDDQNSAIDHLIDALRYDPKNTYALIMLGNIYAKYNDDIDTALKFYNRVIEINPDEFIALNNIGANLLQLNRFSEAKDFFLKAYAIEPKYPNTSYGLSKLFKSEGDLLQAFEYLLNTLKLVNERDQLRIVAFDEIQSTAKEYYGDTDAKLIVDSYKDKLVSMSDKSIDVVQDDTFHTVAKLEVAENHNRDSHLVKYRSNKPCFEHLVMHELVHLDYIFQARYKECNQLFVTDNECKEKYLRDSESFIDKLNRSGLKESDIVRVMDQLFEGLNTQIYNAPIDLFIEKYLFEKFPQLRPVQFLSLLSMLDEYKKATALPDLENTAPLFVIDTNKILILLSVYQFKDLFGINLIQHFKVTNYHKKMATTLYREFVNFQENKEPGYEYKIVSRWSKKLKVDNYFQLIDELSYRKNTVENILTEIEKDPLNLNDEEAKKAESKRTSMTDPAGKMAVTMYCLDALQAFDGQSKEYIREVGFEIGMLGRYGLDPGDNETKYNLKSIPGKTFTALHLLSYMYVSFLDIDPNLDSGLDFKDEYEMALQMFKPKQ